MRWAPDSSFIVAACDLPYLSPEALQWLLTYRRPGIWAVLPGLPGNMKVEPLLSYYDVRARILLEKGTAAGIMKPSQIASHPSVAIVVPPDSLAVAWTNVNTKHDFIYRCP